MALEDASTSLVKKELIKFQIGYHASHISILRLSFSKVLQLKYQAIISYVNNLLYCTHLHAHRKKGGLLGQLNMCESICIEILLSRLVSISCIVSAHRASWSYQLCASMEKDGHKGGKELVITAQVPLNFTLGNKSLSVPVFVQPASEQSYLLGINAIPLLGIRVIQDGGKPILPPAQEDVSKCEVASVSLVE